MKRKSTPKAIVASVATVLTLWTGVTMADRLSAAGVWRNTDFTLPGGLSSFPDAGRLEAKRVQFNGPRKQYEAHGLTEGFFGATRGPLFNLPREGTEEGESDTAQDEGQRPRADQSQLPSIDWGPLHEYFTVSNLRREKMKWRDPLGKVVVLDVLAFTVEAKIDFLIVIFFAQFYDTEGIETSPFSLVSFEPMQPLGWRPGVRSRATVLLPTDFSRVKDIRFSQM